MSSTKLLIVGAGVMGSVVGRWAQKNGYAVTWFDDGRPLSGSAASAGMIIDTWSPLTPVEHSRALHVLEETCGLLSVRFPQATRQDVIGLFVPPRKFLVPHMPLQDAGPEIPWPVKRETVLKVGAGWLVTANSTYTGRVLIATGSWAPELWFKADKVRALAGTSYLLSKELIPAKEAFHQKRYPFLVEWAPYKQIMAFERDLDTVWIGDGTSILRKNYTPARETGSRQRCMDVLGVDLGEPMIRPVTGLRPYVQGVKRGVCEKVMDKTWLLTGGGKSSTILSAHYALQLIKEFK